MYKRFHLDHVFNPGSRRGKTLSGAKVPKEEKKNDIYLFKRGTEKKVHKYVTV